MSEGVRGVYDNRTKVHQSVRARKICTGPCCVVPHRSTTPARSSLTSLFGWEAVSLDDMAALLNSCVGVYND